MPSSGQSDCEAADLSTCEKREFGGVRAEFTGRKPAKAMLVLMRLRLPFPRAGSFRALLSDPVAGAPAGCPVAVLQTIMISRQARETGEAFFCLLLSLSLLCLSALFLE